MICATCRRQLLSNFSSSKSNALIASSKSTTNPSSLPIFPRSYHAAATSLSSAPTAPNSRSSPSITQPLTSPEASSFPDSSQSSTPQLDSTAPNPLPAQKRQLPISKTPGGEVLRGLAYLKNVPAINAKEDDEYPDWLWDLLDETKSAGPKLDEYGLEKIDMGSMTKKQRAKHMKKRRALLSNLPKIIPPHEQATDLTEKGSSPFTHLEKRKEVVKSAREARRKGVRERNYLGGM